LARIFVAPEAWVTERSAIVWGAEAAATLARRA
jgi:hypothetical protein